MLGSGEEAEDLTQDLMLRFWSRRGELKGVNIRHYAMRCVRSECVNRLRREAVRRKFTISNPGKTDVYQHEARDMKEMIVKFIDGLPEKQREVIHFKDVEGYEVAEIAELLGTRESSVRVTLMRARNKVKEQIKQLMDYEERQISK